MHTHTRAPASAPPQLLVTFQVDYNALVADETKLKDFKAGVCDRVMANKGITGVSGPQDPGLVI